MSLWNYMERMLLLPGRQTIEDNAGEGKSQ